MPSPVPFSAIGRLPAPGDNVAIAIRQIDLGVTLQLPDGGEHVVRQAVLEGHRFAVRPIPKGDALLSWGLPFGHALRPIAAGEYVINTSTLQALSVRQLPVTLPAEPNFSDHLVPYRFDPAAISTTEPPAASIRPALSFQGYRRPGGRGIGTRNYIVLLGTTSRTASFVRQLAARLQPLAKVTPGIDGIVPIAHTEGGGTSEPNNSAEVLRALAGFMVHANVAAVLAVDVGVEPITNARLRQFMGDARYPLEHVPHHFLSIRDGLAAGLRDGEQIVRRWLPAAAALRRTPEPVSGLRIALQCGGSDAFSGVSGNPLAGSIVHEVVQAGGTGVLTETDEVMGAEAYLLRHVREPAVAREILRYIEMFKARLSHHGTTAESNPSGGNKLRGLYNITLKAIGAVHKKDPRTRVDFVTNYAERLGPPGFYFMNGPGNDLEGIAGQVAAGCNLFLFITGNGSITNFPFVPTLKITTTTRRHQLLSREMDINAGRYLDGEAMEDLTSESVRLVLATASGGRSKGEHAGHSQVSIWRNWQQTDTSRLAELRARPQPTGLPLVEKVALETLPPELRLRVAALRNPERAPPIGLVLPTSMCSAQIARLSAERMNSGDAAAALHLDRFVALAHSEGCGFGGETMYSLLHRTYRGYAVHPRVASTLLLEHGCEKVPNDAMRRQFESAALPLERFGWASVQLDGGIEKALQKVEQWFRSRAIPGKVGDPPPPPNLAMLSAAPDDKAAAVFGLLAQVVLAAGGSVLIPESDALLTLPTFRDRVLNGTPPRASLANGEPPQRAGLHLVATETDHWVENLTGLGACGAEVFVTYCGDAVQQAHPFIPVIQVASPHAAPAEIDHVLGADTHADVSRLVELTGAALAGNYISSVAAIGLSDFQITRGYLGVTT